MSPSPASILVVDDNFDIRQTLAEVLQDQGHPTTTATDGFDALEKLERQGRPCFILLDLMMPRMSGLEFLERLATHPDSADFVVVVMSGQDALRRQAHKYPNLLATVRKPFDVEQLLSLLHGVTAQGQQKAPFSTAEPGLASEV